MARPFFIWKAQEAPGTDSQDALAARFDDGGAESAGDQHLAAGSYSVERINSSFLAVRNNKTSRITVLMVRGEQGRGLQSNAHLTFQREGRGMYLTQARFAGSSEYVQTVAKPKRDLEYAKGASRAGQVIEVASK